MPMIPLSLHAAPDSASDRASSTACSAGLTLVETVLSLVLAGVLIIMALGTFGSVARGQQGTYNRYMASVLASQLMTEVLQYPYREVVGQAVFGPEPGEATGTRNLFEDVDDYHNWTETPPQLKDGTVMPGLTGWRRTVTVEYLNPDTMAVSGTTDTGLKRITVTVSDPCGIQMAVVALRASNGTYDPAPPPSPFNRLGWVGVDLQIGPDTRAKVSAGANLLNVVPTGGP